MTQCTHSGFCHPDVANAFLALAKLIANTPDLLDLKKRAIDALEAYEQHDHNDGLTVYELDPTPEAHTDHPATCECNDCLIASVNRMAEQTEAMHQAGDIDMVHISVDIADLDAVAIPGKVQFFRAEPYFSNGQEWRSEVLTDVTWRQALILANESMHAVDDLHHVYFEGIEIIEQVDDVKIYGFVMGS